MITNKSFLFGLIVWTAIVGLCTSFAHAQIPFPKIDDLTIVPTAPLNFKLKTLGGKQFWTDIHHTGGWRVQENAVTAHYRLIDKNNVRHAWGAQEDCRQKLQSLIESGDAAPLQGKVVIVLHGLIRTTGSMRKIGKYLEDNSDLTAVDFEYASTRKPVAYHAEALKKVIESLGPEVTEINFVCHSLGNIVVRRYLADEKRNCVKPDPRFNRMVMIGPPNQGSKMARLLKRSFLFNVIAGSCGLELGGNWEKLEPTLAVPEFEFGIIAGGQSSTKNLSNFVLSGKDDFTVSVEETRLVGARDFLIEPLLHSTMMRQPVTMKATLNFLKNGWFVSDEARNPIVSLDESS